MLNRRSILMAGAVSALPFQRLLAADAASKIEMRRGRLFIKAAINGRPTMALLDTAAELSLVDRAFAAGIGLSDGKDVEARGSGAGTQSASIVEGVRLEAAGVLNDKGTVALIDLSDVSRRLNGAPITLILGRDYFELARFQIDLSRRVMSSMTSADSPRGQGFDLIEEFGVLAMPVRAENRDAHAVIDLGNGGLPLISREFAQSLGALSDGRPIKMDTGGGIGGAADRETFSLSNLQIAGRTFPSVRVAVDAGKNSSDLNVGTSILRHFQMTLDFAQKKIWLSPLHR